MSVRLAGPADAGDVARLLHDFNTEFDTPTPGAAVLASRLRRLLGDDTTFAVLAGDPALGVALVTLRTNVWFDGPVALLDELYVEPRSRRRRIGAEMIDAVIATSRARGVGLVEVNVDEGDVDAQRFYERHGFSGRGPVTGERAFYYELEL